MSIRGHRELFPLRHELSPLSTYVPFPVPFPGAGQWRRRLQL